MLLHISEAAAAAAVQHSDGAAVAVLKGAVNAFQEYGAVTVL